MDTTARLKHLNRIRRVSRLMDTAFRIPVIGVRVGWDPIIGLVPGAGDLIATAISAYILIMAARFRLPKGVLGWMIFNIGLEFVVGTIPLLGDIFDAFYKSNVRNLALLEKHLQSAAPQLQEADPMNLESAGAGTIQI